MLEKMMKKMYKRKKCCLFMIKKDVSLKNPSQHSILHFMFKIYLRVNSYTFNVCHLIYINSILPSHHETYFMR